MTDTVTTQETTQPELKVGYVYKDKRDIDVLIVRKVVIYPVNEPNGLVTFSFPSTRSADYPFIGVAMGNQTEVASYAPTGQYTMEHDNSWEKDLLLETGRLWESLIPSPTADYKVSAY